MGTYALVADLPLRVEDYALEGLDAEVSSGFERLTTVIRLRGAGEEGVGEDVVYEGLDHVAQQSAGPLLPLAGVHTLDSFCRRLGELDLFPGSPPVRGEVSRLYRRWAFQSAGLDLALRQAGLALHDALERKPAAVSYVVSLRLGEPPAIDPVRRRLAIDSSLRFKLDPTSSWSDDLIAELQATGAVDSVDFKGLYRGTVVDQGADPALYKRVAEAFPHAWMEDPDLSNPDCAAALEPHRDRITWDAPIHGIADIEALPFPPRMVNVKPSRLGGVKPLLDAYDYCAQHDISAYGGGQFELGPGRGQAQYLASLFHPDTPNDLAPTGWNRPDPSPGLPSSPLRPRPTATGFRWDAGGEIGARSP